MTHGGAGSYTEHYRRPTGYDEAKRRYESQAPIEELDPDFIPDRRVSEILVFNDDEPAVYRESVIRRLLEDGMYDRGPNAREIHSFRFFKAPELIMTSRRRLPDRSVNPALERNLIKSGLLREAPRKVETPESPDPATDRWLELARWMTEQFCEPNPDRQAVISKLREEIESRALDLPAKPGPIAEAIWTLWAPKAWRRQGLK